REVVRAGRLALVAPTGSVDTEAGVLHVDHAEAVLAALPNPFPRPIGPQPVEERLAEVLVMEMGMGSVELIAVDDEIGVRAGTRIDPLAQLLVGAHALHAIAKLERTVAHVGDHLIEAQTAPRPPLRHLLGIAA